jgi:hypothetical protein
VEATINSLRRPEELRPEELQGQLDQLTAEYAQLLEHTATIENINKEGGKFIRDAKVSQLAEIEPPIYTTFSFPRAMTSNLANTTTT